MPINKLVKTNEEGLALIETIAALGLAIIVITTLVSLSVFTLRSSNRGKVLLESSKVSSEQLELVRAYRDDPLRTWNDFITDLTTANAGAGCSGSVNETTHQVTDGCHMVVSTSGGPPSLSVGDNVNFTNDPIGGGTTQDKPTEVMYWFHVSDPINGDGVSTDDDVVQIRAGVRYRIGSQLHYSYIYSDISNWRGTP